MGRKADGFFAAVIAGFLLLHASSASAMTGNDVYQVCGSSNADNQFACMMYVVGVSDGIVMEALSNRKFPICVPPGVTNKELLDMFVKKLRDHPELRHYDAGALAYDMLVDNFPCPKQ